MATELDSPLRSGYCTPPDQIILDFCTPITAPKLRRARQSICAVIDEDVSLARRCFRDFQLESNSKREYEAEILEDKSEVYTSRYSDVQRAPRARRPRLRADDTLDYSRQYERSPSPDKEESVPPLKPANPNKPNRSNSPEPYLNTSFSIYRPANYVAEMSKYYDASQTNQDTLSNILDDSRILDDSFYD